MKPQSTKKKLQLLFKYIPLVIVPFLFVLLCFHLIKIFGPLSHRHSDPDYAYLLTGVSIGHLRFDIGHVDHPGTPLQIVVALVTRLTHLFTGHGSYLTDTLSRPDFYLQNVLIFNLLFIAIIFLYMGIELLPVVKNYLMVILLQIAFFSNWAVFNNIFTVVPEVIIIIPVTLLVIQLVKYMYNPETGLKNKNAIVLAIICGFGLSIKLDYFPLIFIPIFILKGWKQYAIYVSTIFISFLLFAFPVIQHWTFFFSWVKGLIIHTGVHGEGDSNFVNINEFAQNIQSIINHYPLFYIVICLFIVVLILSKYNYFKASDRKFENICYGLILTVSFHTALVAKHFGTNYIIPSVYLLPFILFLIIYRLTASYFIRYGLSVLTIVAVLFLFNNEMKRVLNWKIPELEAKNETCNAIREKVGLNPFMIMDQPLDFYFQESSLLFGWFFQGNNRLFFKTELEKQYPFTYVYDEVSNKFFLWGDLYSEREIIEKYSLIYLFINGSKYDTFIPILSNIENLAKTECIYINKKTNDRLYSITKY